MARGNRGVKQGWVILLHVPSQRPFSTQEEEEEKPGWLWVLTSQEYWLMPEIKWGNTPKSVTQVSFKGSDKQDDVKR